MAGISSVWVMGGIGVDSTTYTLRCEPISADTSRSYPRLNYALHCGTCRLAVLPHGFPFPGREGHPLVLVCHAIGAICCVDPRGDNSVWYALPGISWVGSATSRVMSLFGYEFVWLCVCLAMSLFDMLGNAVGAGPTHCPSAAREKAAAQTREGQQAATTSHNKDFSSNARPTKDSSSRHQ